MRLPRSRLKLVMVLFLASLLNNCKCKAKKAMEALDNFVGFSQGEDFTEGADESMPAYRLKNRVEEYVTGRSRIRAEVEVDPTIDHQTLGKVLRDACHDSSIHGNCAAVKITAWPGRLRKLASPLGECVFARDGHGWEGTGVGFEEIKVFIATPAQMQELDLEGITQGEYLLLLGVENMLRQGSDQSAAIQSTASRHEVPADEVHQAIDKATKLWGIKANAPR
jgi:hypothetical protein